MAGEVFQSLQHPALLEGPGIELQCGRSAEAAGAAAVGFLGRPGMRRAVGAQKELRITGRGGVQQRLAMGLPLQDRKAVEMRSDAAHQQAIAVEQQVLGGDGGRQPVGTRPDEVDGFPGGDVLEDDLQLGVALQQWREHPFDERRLPIEDVDPRVGNLAMYLQGQPHLGHGRERLIAVADIGDPEGGVGGGAGGVELHAMDDPAFPGAADFRRRGPIGQIKRHQRLEITALGQRSDDPTTVGARSLGGGHRRLEIGHDDGAGELTRAVGQGRGELVAVANVQVPVIGPGERQAVHASIRGGWIRTVYVRKARGFGRVDPGSGFAEG